LAEAVCCSDPA